MNVSQDVWIRVLEEMKKNMTETTINTWFDDTEAVSMDDDEFILCTRSEWKRSIINARYLPSIENALYELFSSRFHVSVLSEEEVDRFRTPQSSSFLPGTEEFTFDHFVVGESNQFAYNAAIAVAGGGANKYNPLFIYGPSGLGKTHLMFAIAHKVHENNPKTKIVYVKSESFLNEMVSCLARKTMDDFRAKYRSADLMLVDDIQFITGKEAFQNEFFHTFNAIYDTNHQLVLTSDRPPKEISRLDRRLQTRFESGLMADIKPPDLETRLAILKAKSIRMGLSLPESVFQYLAENLTSNIRQIEGAVNKLKARREIMGEDIDYNTVVHTVDELMKEPLDMVPTADIIITEVCKYAELSREELVGPSRESTVANYRQITIYLIRTMTQDSLNQIGRIFNRDRSTIIHSVQKITSQVDHHEKNSEIIKDLKYNINNSISKSLEYGRSTTTMSKSEKK